MPRDMAVFSLLVPSLLSIFLGCVAVFIALDLLLSRVGLYRHVWHPALFRASLFTTLFAAIGMLLHP
ncbi:MAG: DUF1656 domain-containing protein [Rhodanobacter sp.]